MATIPLEIIVQDTEVPVVPSEDGTNNTETNIIVPDTGTISSSGDTSSSASSIILPAILLVLAIGSIVAILIHRHGRHKTFKNKVETSKKEKLAVVITSTIAMLAATVLVGNLVLPATRAATSNESSITTADKISVVVTRNNNNEEKNENEVAIGNTKDTIYVNSESTSNYEVYMALIGNNTNIYLNGDETSEYYIAPVEASDEEGTGLTDNTWGYALEEGENYLPVPLADEKIVITEGKGPETDKELNIYYGVKVDSTLPTGTYKGEIEYSIAEVQAGFPDSLVYMQDMTHEICEAVATPGNQVTDPVPTATLEDIRDHNTYTIAKLADGKCWMTQNLDLDLKTDGTITYDSTNTNLTVAGSGAYVDGYTTENGIITWTPANATINFTGSAVEGWSSSGTAPSSANPGDVYYYTSNSDANDIKYNLLTDCVAAGHTAEDCKHYHAGNYYNWSAAVASNDSSSLTTQYDNAANSICPAGWRLPNGPSAESTDYSEMADVVRSYSGILADTITEDCGGYCNYYKYLANGFDVIRAYPLWLTRAGYVPQNGPDSFGEYGVYHFATTNKISSFGKYIYALVFRYGGFNPTGATYSRHNGFSVRCAAK